MADVPSPTSSASAQVPPRRMLTGPVFREFIWDVIARKNARNYLEVGVHAGLTLTGVTVPAIGVDPKFVIAVDPVGAKRILHLYQMTSDEFFRDHDPRAIFGGPVDVAFLDGMHLFEYLLRDFMNTERCCSRDSVIMLDDCLPPNIEMTERERRPEARQDRQLADWWTGDVWKVVSILRRFRPDLQITPVNVRPTGSIVVRNLDPASTVLADRYSEIVELFMPLEFSPETFDAYWTINAPRSI